MANIEYCKRCLYGTDHPLGLILDAAGICSGCRIHEEKDELDWERRWARLEEIVKPYRVQDKTTYDCIVPVSGAQDSYYIVDKVKNHLGMNPLLVTYNKYWNTPLGIRNLANLRIKFNCDILYQNVNPEAVKRITKTTIREMASIYWHCIAGQTVFPVQTAVRYKVPLIIWGAHQGTEQVGMFSHLHEVEMTRRYRKDHDLMGLEADDLLSNFDVLTERDIWQYRYPDDADLDAVGVRGLYLSNFVRWDSKAQHEEMIRKYEFETAPFERTFDTYDFVDCYNYMNLHDEIKFLKHGYGKVLDHACREIRHGRLERPKAIELVVNHSQAAAAHVELFCEWLGVSERALRFVLDTHRSDRIWQQLANGQWHRISYPDWWPKDEAISDSNSEFLQFIRNSSLDRELGKGYITVGKGWP